MFQNCVSFQKATEMFYSMQYDQGLNIINDCISKDPMNSILYSNRALFFSQLGYVEQALSDLNLAIELNYLNYIAYFNMFSLLMRIQKFDEAFQNLCCSLSCLYLIRAKTRKSELDASKAIKYAQNNMEAHVLKGLIHLQNGKYKLALNQLDWACEIKPQDGIVRNIRSMIFKKMNPGLAINENQVQSYQEDNKNEPIRLQSSYTFEQNDREKELRDKILEFNEIYNNLNEFQGTITTKVPKDQEEIQNEAEVQHDSVQPHGPEHLYQEEKRDKTQLQQTKIESSNKPISEYKIEQKLEINLKEKTKTSEQIYTNNQTMMDENSINVEKEQEQSLAEKVAQKLKANPQIFYGQVSTRSPHESKESIVQGQRQLSHSDNFSRAILADDGVATPSSASLAPEPGQYGHGSQHFDIQDVVNVSENSKYFQSLNDKESENFSEFQSMINSHHSEQLNTEEQKKVFDEDFESIINDHQSQSQEISMISNALYPKPENAMLQFSILKLQILNMPQEKIAQMKNIYCIANYLNMKQQNLFSNFKLRTACQKGFGKGTEWNQTFDPIEIPQSPECMKIKVYNKKYSSYRDDLIGQMEVEITTHGLVKLPLFNKKGQLSGSLFMNLQLVFPAIKEVDEIDEVEEV